MIQYVYHFILRISEKSSDSDSSFLTSSEDEDTDSSTATKPRDSIIKLAASVKSGTAEVCRLKRDLNY